MICAIIFFRAVRSAPALAIQGRALKADLLGLLSEFSFDGHDFGRRKQQNDELVRFFFLRFYVIL